MTRLTRLEVDVDRLLGQLDALARFSDAPAPAVTRVLFTPADLAGRAYIQALCQEVGLALRQDGAGNLFARWEGADPDLAPVATGSHIDAIPHSGRYDGTVGVLGALEAIRILQAAGYRPRRPIELLVFTAEEPTRFGVGCVGSRILTGVLSPADLASLTDAEGRSFDAVRREAGFSAPLEEVAVGPGAYDAFIELHIEQGPVLERLGVPIGVVTAIAAPCSLRLLIAGEGGHAGTVLMPDRHDALLAGAEVALAVEAAARSTGSPDTVATTGRFEVHPGAVNSIPSRVLMEIDLRDVDLAARERALEAIRSSTREILARRGVEGELAVLNADPPAASDPRLVAAIEAVCTELSMESHRMVSRAYHDTLFMARIAPVAMIFIPCRGGISHRPDEEASPEAIRDGVRVLAATLARLAA